MNTIEKRTIVRHVAAFVSDALGEGWSVDTSEAAAEYHGAHLDGPDGARLWLSLGGRNYTNDENRLSIRGQYPKPEETTGWRSGWSKPYGETRRDEISVARDRDPAIIAREIQRRLLPDYLAMLAEAVEYNAQADAGVRKARALRTDIATRMGAGTRIDEARGEVSTPYRGHSDRGVNASFKVPEHGSVEVELRWLSDDQALKLADFVAAL